MAIISEQISGNTINVDVQSTNIKSATYNTSEKLLTIMFNNNCVYDYYDVPWDVFTKFRLSKSQGKFFNSEISKTYKYKKMR